MENSIIVIDDERDFLDSVRRGLITSRFNNVHLEVEPEKAAADFKNGKSYDIALIDITMPGMNGIELLEIIKNSSPKTECIMITAVDKARVAIKCLRKGAYDYLVKPISKEDLILSISRALERKRLIEILDIGKKKSVPKLNNVEAFQPIVTKSDTMFKIIKEAELHATSDVPILITGDTGTGKELLARAIHAASPRANHVFTPVNMDALTNTLFDSEFFGHTKGAFTGAEADRPGHLEHTNKGTLFLDEIGNLALELQGKLLRVLEDGEFTKIGTSQLQKTDVRFIAATNKDLDSMMAKNRFRKDLYYRLRGGWLHLPPLKERKEDIALLISRFLEDICGPSSADIEHEAMTMLLNYDYPGNIRELKAIIHSAVNLAQGKSISVNCLPALLTVQKSRRQASPDHENQQILPLSESEKKYILSAYAQLGGNKSLTARTLGIGLNTLRRKLESYGVS